ncbi:contractile injection system tape measure protein [Chitinophaga sp. Hz27]|uniref:contractile injection system tape measure protein n=1 Tax=Chitinophaga sp. Hz27 TaxID=3347169 RepID=UPI0035DFEA67
MTEHLIQKQIVSIRMRGDEMQAMALQREINTLCEGPLLQMMEQLFDLYDNGQQVIIDKLEINISERDIHLLTPAIMMAVSKEISHALQQKTGQDESNAIEKKRIDHLTKNIKQASSTAYYTPQQLISILGHFLQTGQLPWWAALSDFYQLTTEMLPAVKFAKTLQQQLIQVLQQSPAAQYRFLHQFTDSWQMSWLQALQPEIYTAIVTAVTAVIQLQNTIHPTINTRSNTKTSTVAQLLQQLRPWILNYIITHSENKPDEATIVASVIQQTEKIDIQVDEKMLINILPTAIQEAVAIQLHQPIQKIISAPSAISKKEVMIHNESTTTTTDGYFIHNAGLILLAPFLGTFLRACNAADDKKVTNESYAVALLEFLATGRTDVAEHELIFNKVLCGIPVDKPLQRINNLQDEHITEATQLLQTVIGYWNTLKNTSVDGLRVSFLQRTGKLSVRENDDQWRLQVIPESYDQFLLVDLPWNYQLVPLLFNKQQFIWVEWL